MIPNVALLLTLLAAPPPGELMWWAPDAPATGLAVRDGAVMRGLGPGRSEWWPLDGDPPRLMPRHTPCPSATRVFDPPAVELPDRLLPWGPIVALAEGGDGCALASTVAGPIVRYGRDAVAEVLPRTHPARLVATDPACRLGAVVDEDTLRVFPIGDEAQGEPRTIPLEHPATGLVMTDGIAALTGPDGGLDLYRLGGGRWASVDLGAPVGCATSGESLFVAETVDARTRAHALVDGGLRWGRPPVDPELGALWRADPPSRIEAMAVAEDGRIAAVVEGRVRLWDPGAGMPRAMGGPSDVIDVAISSDGRQAAVRRPEAIELWRLDGTPRRGRRLPIGPPPETRWGPSLLWIGADEVVALTEDAVVPLLGASGPPRAISAPRALLADRGRGSVVTAAGVAAMTRPQGKDGRPVFAVSAVQPFARRIGAATGAAWSCDADAALAVPGRGWIRPLAADGGAAVSLCPTRITDAVRAQLRMGSDGVALDWSLRARSGPPVQRTAWAPLFGEVQAATLHPDGRVTALLDGLAIVRWRPGGGVDRATWVVVGGQDVVALAGRVAGSPRARGSLGWWLPTGVVSAAEAPTLDGPALLDAAARLDRMGGER